jgi:hypothetical protein
MAGAAGGDAQVREAREGGARNLAPPPADARTRLLRPAACCAASVRDAPRDVINARSPGSQGRDGRRAAAKRRRSKGEVFDSRRAVRLHWVRRADSADGGAPPLQLDSFEVVDAADEDASVLPSAELMAAAASLLAGLLQHAAAHPRLAVSATVPLAHGACERGPLQPLSPAAAQSCGPERRGADGD